MTGRSWPAVFAVVVALAAGACGDDGSGGDDGGPQQSVRGVVVQVEARSLTELEFVDVQDDTGFVWRFQPGDTYRGFTPSHLREHMVQGLPVTVKYRQRDTALVMDGVTD